MFDAPSGGTPLDIDVIYTPLKSAFNGYNFVANIIGLSSFVKPWLPPEVVKSREIPTKFDLNSSSSSSKVIDVGVNRKPMYDFLLVTDSNFGRICYRFPDIDA